MSALFKGVKMNPRKYWCKECDVTFWVGTRLEDNVHCPSCADHYGVFLKKRHDKRWTQREINQAIELLNQGSTYMQVAAKLKRSLDSVTRKATRLGKDGKLERVTPQSKRWTEEEITKLIQMVQEKHSYHKISEVLGRTARAVSIKMTKLKNVGRLKIN